MLGGYVGQFLPLSGGSNFPMAGGLYLNGNGVFYDSVASAQSDGNGNFYAPVTTTQFYSKSADTNADAANNNAAFQVLDNWTLSGSNASTDLLVNRNVSGSSTGTQLLADFQLNGVSKFHLLTTGDFYASGGNVTTSSGIVTAKGFRPPSWSANTTIFVDPINGADNTGNGSQTNPYKTPAKAASVAVSGNLIFLAPGTYASNNQIVLPNGVSITGSGVGVTILQPNGTWIAGMSALIVPGTGSDVSDMTVDLTQSSTINRPACVGCSDSVSGNTQFGLNPTMHRVKCINTGTAFQYTASSTSGTSYVYLEDCIWVSNGRCTQWTMTPGTLSVDEFRCQHLWTCATSAGAMNVGECAFAQGNPSRFFFCLFSMTDTVNSSWTNLTYQTIDADSPVELYAARESRSGCRPDSRKCTSNSCATRFWTRRIHRPSPGRPNTGAKSFWEDCCGGSGLVFEIAPCANCAGVATWQKAEGQFRTVEIQDDRISCK
jgi:hypothetical protein